MSLASQEEKALACWKPPADTLFNRSLTLLVVAVSRFIMRRMNSLSIEGGDTFQSLLLKRDRGLLTFSNHVSLFDDPLLVCNLRLPPYRQIRWVASDALNFFGSPWKAFIFGAGKCVPIVRGVGFDQLGFDFLRDRLKEGAWVHIFPEGGRTRDPQALLTHPFKPGIGRLMAEARPVALPFYHTGMQRLLPVGAKLPRWRKKIRLVFGEPINCDKLVREDELSGPRLWEALAERSYHALRAMEIALHPAAVGTHEVRGPAA